MEKMEKPKKPAQFLVTEEHYWRLRELASSEQKTLSVFLRDAVQAYINGMGAEIDLAGDFHPWGVNRRKKNVPPDDK